MDSQTITSERTNAAVTPVVARHGDLRAAGSTPKDRILIVDDSRVVRRMFSMALAAKYDCVEAGSFDEAVCELKANEFAVMITDIIMPGMSGIELLRKVVSDFPGIEVIVVSGVDRSQRALDAVRLGAFDYLIKPCELDVLELTVERALERRRLLIEARQHQLHLETQNAELKRRREQLEQLQAQIIQNEKMASLGQLAAGIAHEINNPIGFVHANLEMLDQYIQDLVRLIRSYDNGAENEIDTRSGVIKSEIGYPAILDDIDSMVTDCREGAERIKGIVQNLRTFSRLDEAEFKETDIHEGIDATVRLLSRYFSLGNIELIRDYGDLPRIGGYAGQINQVWMNLLVNAAQSIGSGRGTITVKTSADDENIYVEVRDTGCGIAVQNLSRIFDPFFTTKPVGEGTGLGLSISFGIVERHGGSIVADSRLNSGTSFNVRLPRRFEPTLGQDDRSIVAYQQNQNRPEQNL